MSNKQYSIFNEEVEDLYIDQSAFSGYPVSSVYTPHGIKCIETEYSILIISLGKKIKNVFSIRRRTILYSVLKTREVIDSYDYYTFYDKLNPGDPFYSDVRIEWEEGNHKDFFYTHPPLTDNFEIDVPKLKTSIHENPHLHVLIKEDLLHNLQRRNV